MKKAGIIGGLGAMASVEFYKNLIEFGKRRYNSVAFNLIINHLNSETCFSLMYNEKGIVKFLINEIKKIENEVDFICIVCNTAHYAINEIRREVSKPIIPLHEVVCDYIQKQNINKVGILATDLTINNLVYQNIFNEKGISFELLNSEEINELTCHIKQFVTIGDNQEEFIENTEKCVDRLLAKDCDSILLGCTDITIAIPENNDIQLFSSIEIYADKIIDIIFENGLNNKC